MSPSSYGSVFRIPSLLNEYIVYIFKVVVQEWLPYFLEFINHKKLPDLALGVWPCHTYMRVFQRPQSKFVLHLDTLKNE